MKIAIADNNNRKFTADLIKHWTDKGHEVKFETGASEYLAQWADLYYVDTWDNNIHYLWKLYHGIEGVSRTPDWDNKRKPTIAVRALDWELWIGLMRDQTIVDWVDKIIFIAKHIQEKVNTEVQISSLKQALITPGVSIERFTVKEKQTNGFQLGMVLGDMWKYKNHMGGLDIFTSLYELDKRWRLHIRGQHENGMYDPANWDYYLQSRRIQDVVTLYPPIGDMNQWYENIDILLHPGQKEAFCYAIAEATAKDIPVIANDFLGSHDIWPTEMLYQTHAEAVEKIVCQPRSKRDFLLKHYTNERMFAQMDSFLGV